VSVENTDTLSSTGQPIASVEDIKQRRKENRAKFLERIRQSLGTVVHQVALSPAQAAIACGKSPTWAYRKVYSGDFRVISSEGRMLIPRSEIERYLANATAYNPQPQKNGDKGNGRD
jgi:hypothetical protein